jgi:hypothetical protein
VTLLNSSASGRVEYLGDQIVDGRTIHLFWWGNTRGNPFPVSAPPGASQGIDRLVAIGTTAHGTDLRYLKLDSRFVDILAPHRGGADKDLDDNVLGNPPREQWTATQVVMRCRS